MYIYSDYVSYIMVELTLFLWWLYDGYVIYISIDLDMFLSMVDESID